MEQFLRIEDESHILPAVDGQQNLHRSFISAMNTSLSSSLPSMPHISRVPPMNITDISKLRMSTGTSETGSKSPNAQTYQSSTPGSYGPRSEARDEDSSCPGDRYARHTSSQPLHSAATGTPDKGGSFGSEENVLREPVQSIFRQLEDYITVSFTSRECINASFITVRPSLAPGATSEEMRRAPADSLDEKLRIPDDSNSAMDARSLLISDFAGNGSSWSGGREPLTTPSRSRSHQKNGSAEKSNTASEFVTIKSPRIDWTKLSEWYRTVLCAGNDWENVLHDLNNLEVEGRGRQNLSVELLRNIGDQILDAQARTRRVLLKATETLLKRPGCILKEPHDIRFLMVILANPLLYPLSNDLFAAGKKSKSMSTNCKASYSTGRLELNQHDKLPPSTSNFQESNRGPGQHSGIIKRVLGLLSNLPNECHHYLVSWFARFSERHFHRIIELIGSFVTYRLTRQHSKPRSIKHDLTAGLVPNLTASSYGSSAALHAALGVTAQSNKQIDGRPKAVVYNDDWQIKAAARVMALLFSANNSGTSRRADPNPLSSEPTNGTDMAARETVHHHGQILATSEFYNTLLDYSDLIADFEAWESKRGKFSFCQYPFFLSIWAKIQIMEYDARRQMEVKAREAFFDSIMTRKAVQQYLILRVRRECLVEDSLKGVSEVVGSGSEDIKKGLRIEFRGEEGIDAGGLRKEWFLLLVRDVFNPEHGKR
jgi:E3 ubiquitin-protein ligase HECTD2